MNFVVFAFKAGMTRAKHHVMDELRRQGHNIFWVSEDTCIDADYGFDNFISLVFDPSLWAQHDKPNGRCLVYWCVDEWSAFPHLSMKTLETEFDLLRRSRFVIASSQKLADTKRHINRQTFYIPHGVDYELFRQACFERKGTYHTIGYFGTLGSWLNFAWLNAVAQTFPSKQLVLIGKQQGSCKDKIQQLCKYPNVTVKEAVEHHHLVTEIAQWDIAIAPFLVNRQTWFANSIKLREYLAAGLPVITTDLPEARRLRFTRRASTRKELITYINKVLENNECRFCISDSQKEETWSHRVSQFLDLLTRYV